LFIGWGSWWVYCSIEAISPPNVWIDFAKIMLAKLCVRTCCRRHESLCSSCSLPSMDGGTNDETEGWMERTTLRGQNQVYYISRFIIYNLFIIINYL
jgi:hypothetical protein